MKRLALLTLCLLALAAPAMAQSSEDVGDVSIYADNLGNSCDLVITGGFAQWQLVHKFDPGDGGSTGARFKLIIPAGVTIVGFNTPFVTIGDLPTDLSIAYGVCIQENTAIGTVTVIGTAGVCTYAVLAEPTGIYPTPIATDCSFGEYFLKTGAGIVNGDGSCPCNIATQPTTWGKVKSLYR